MQILHSRVLLMLLLLVSTMCTAPKKKEASNSRPPTSNARRSELVGQATVSGSTVVASLKRFIFCPSEWGSRWQVCDEMPAKHVAVALTFSGGSLAALTDEQGVARFEMGKLDPPPVGIGDNSVASISAMNAATHLTTVDLSRLDVFPEWKKKVLAQNGDAKATGQKDAVDEEAARQAAELELDKKAPRVTMQDLVVEPKKFHGKLVRMRRVVVRKVLPDSGWLKDEFDNNNLMLKVVSETPVEAKRAWFCLPAQENLLLKRDIWIMPSVDVAGTELFLIRIDEQIWVQFPNC